MGIPRRRWDGDEDGDCDGMGIHHRGGMGMRMGMGIGVVIGITHRDGMRMGKLTGMGKAGRDGTVQTWAGCPQIPQDDPPWGSVKMLGGAVTPQCPSGCNTARAEHREGT